MNESGNEKESLCCDWASLMGVARGETMAMQFRFRLAGTAGAIVYKNQRSAWWGYHHIVE